MMTVIQNAFANTSSSIMISKVQGNIVDTLMPPLSPGRAAGGLPRRAASRAASSWPAAIAGAHGRCSGLRAWRIRCGSLASC
jgi:ABC-2 type transport system permease protein